MTPSMQSGKAKCFSSSLHGHSILTATMFFCSAMATVSSASTQGRVKTPLVKRMMKFEDLRTQLSNSSRSRNSTESRNSNLSESNCGPSRLPAPVMRFRKFRMLGVSSDPTNSCVSEVEMEAVSRPPALSSVSPKQIRLSPLCVPLTATSSGALRRLPRGVRISPASNNSDELIVLSRGSDWCGGKAPCISLFGVRPKFSEWYSIV
mmetsp:Transcript_42408/g.114412  ORF Transcript_42408/g.114412 Transcript_42408/m.114412 type:complete len:206 (+) Transcript_42408:434-1051(+)